MVPLVRWLNNFQYVTTLYCCQGDDSDNQCDKPYVLWTCGNDLALVTILKTFGYSAITEIAWHEQRKQLEYCTRFHNKNSFKSVMNKIPLTWTNFHEKEEHAQ